MDRSRFDSCLPYVDEEQATHYLRQWVDKVKFEGPKGGPCLACEKVNSCRYYNDQHLFACSYCGLSISAELVYAACASKSQYKAYAPGSTWAGQLIHEVKKKWQWRLELLQEVGTEVFVEILNQRGFNIKTGKTVTSHIHEIYEEMIKAQLVDPLTVSNKLFENKPKPWSYKEAAASEFNLDPDDSGLV